MRNLIPIFTILALLMFTPNAKAQRPGGGRGRPGGPPPGLDQGDQDIQNQQFGNRFGNQKAANEDSGNQNFANQNATNQNMPTVQQLAQMMIANFDADGSSGLEQAELQNALTALRQMMQNRNNGRNQGLANQQDNAANAQNQFGLDALGQNNQVPAANANIRPRRNAGANNFRAGGRGR